MIEIERLRQIIPDVLADAVKAYNLPAICVGFGLAEGEESEAYSSKRSYIRNRIAGLQASAVIELGQRINERFPDQDLEEALHLAEEHGKEGISELTRRKVLALLSETDSISGRLDLLDFLGRVFPLRQYISDFLSLDTLEDEIWKHMILNDDWDLNHLFVRLRLLGCSEHRFTQFIELCVHPMVRDGCEQAGLVEELNELLRIDGQVLAPVDTVSGEPIYKLVALTGGVSGYAKNLIFAAEGPKPEIVLTDAINNDVKIVRNAEHCLIFDRPFGANGLRWGDLIDWWAQQNCGLTRSREAEESLYKRLLASLDSEPEKFLFREYFKKYHPEFEWDLPALLPQVYLHYDPYTARMRQNMKVVTRQRMDFLILFSPRERVVLEVDGKQHYSEGDRASPHRYAEMVSADRDLRLIGYEVYRFGGSELAKGNGDRIVEEFFRRLFLKHGVRRNSN